MFVTTGDGNFIYSQADENQKGKVARLVSPVVSSQSSAHCMTFWYHMSGSHVGTLRVKLHYQKPEEYDQLVWMAIGHQGDHWKEGRVLLHKSLKLYQVLPHAGLGGAAQGTGWKAMAMPAVPLPPKMAFLEPRPPCAGSRIWV